MERSLSFEFEFPEDEHDLPNSVAVTPNPNELEDNVLLLAIAACTRVLATRHGLEVALKMADDANYGRLGEHRFDMLWGELEDPQL